MVSRQAPASAFKAHVSKAIVAASYHDISDLELQSVTYKYDYRHSVIFLDKTCFAKSVLASIYLSLISFATAMSRALTGLVRSCSNCLARQMHVFPVCKAEMAE